MNYLRTAIGAIATFIAAEAPAFAWGHAGHEVVGSIADQLLKANARTQVSRILGFELRIAGPWADCVKSVVRNPDKTFSYAPDPNHPDYRIGCESFEAGAEKARMETYAGRNWDNCVYDPRRGCHNAFHFADVAEQRDRYDRQYHGTSDHDLVSALNAAISVLRGTPAPAPFSITDEKEALLLITHFLGDLHQPLHVGAIYLDLSGAPVDPDSGGPFDEKTEATAGGNFIFDQGANFHTEWDTIPPLLGRAADPAMVEAARSVLATDGPIETWIANWATDTIVASHGAFAGASFAAAPPRHWDIVFSDRNQYILDQDKMMRFQLAKAGARLNQLLNAIWPTP